MECFGTTDFDNNSWLITLSAIIISGLHCIKIPEHTKLTDRTPPCCDTKAIWQIASSSTRSQLFIFCMEHLYKHLPQCIWSKWVFLWMLQTKYKQLLDCTWSGYLSYSFGVTAWWICVCQYYVFCNFNIWILTVRAISIWVGVLNLC
jgi:hypothetical protein